MKTVFQKILDGEIPAKFVYRDELCAAINDINPQAPTHILLFPVEAIERLEKADAQHEKILGHLMLCVQKIAKELDLKDGFRVVINNGILAGETVPHLHIHILSGRPLHWPPG